MKAILDTGVRLRGLMNPFGTWGQLGRRTGEFRLLTSSELDDEFGEVLGRARLQDRLQRFSETDEYRLIAEAFAAAEPILNPPPVRVCRDENDDMFFACALAGGAEYIVSEDEDILAVGEYEGIRAVRAVEFLQILDRAALTG